MMSDVKRSRRGVYYDLTVSPYEYKTPYGDIFKFSSEKKLEIYTRDIQKELKRATDFLNRNDLIMEITNRSSADIYHGVYFALYRRVER